MGLKDLPSAPLGGTRRYLVRAENGPQYNADGITMLDAPGTLRIHPLAVMHSYDCAEDKWAAHLA